MSELEHRAKKLELHGLIAHWNEVAQEPWVQSLVGWEEDERSRRSRERRLRRARLGTFKPISDFDWTWPKSIDREQIETLLRLDWIGSAANVLLVGPNGCGKTMIAKNLAHQAVLAGLTVRFLTASEMLTTLAEQDSSTGLRRKLALFVRPQLLVVDEVGYISYDNRYADLLFEVVSRRYEKRPILITTNRPFLEWGNFFPNAASVVTLVDRLVHRSEIVQIAGDSYRLKESREKAKARKRPLPATRPRPS